VLGNASNSDLLGLGPLGVMMAFRATRGVLQKAQLNWKKSGK